MPAVLVCGFITLLYLRTMAPGLTWAHDGADGGDLITAVATGGVPHPTGYPTYITVASAFLQLPVGPLAFRTNLLSLVATVLAAAVLYSLVLEASRSVLAASVAAMVFGTAPLIWSQAIITEVYALQALLTAGFLRLLLTLRRGNPIEIALGLMTGLILGNHLMGALLLPLLLLRPEGQHDAAAAVSKPHRIAPPWLIRVLLPRLLGLAIGLAIYLIIPLRAGSHAPVSWGNASSLPALLRLISGQMYWSRFQELSIPFLGGGLRAWAQLVTEQLTLPGLLAAITGLVLLFPRTRLYLVTVWIAFAYSVLSIVYYSVDSYVYMIPVLMACAVWIGLATRWLSQQASARVPNGGNIVGAVAVGLVLLRGLAAIPSMDISTDREAEQFARTALAQAPTDSILLTEGDEATFALWYFHYALRGRPDVAIVSNDLFAQAWYREVLRYTYPDLELPNGDSATAFLMANPGRAVCGVTSLVPARLACLLRIGASVPALEKV